MEIIEKSQLPRFERHVFVADIDGNVTKTFRTFYKDLSRALRFPDYFEENLDSLYDCLTSLEDVENEDVVLIVKNVAAMLSSEPPAKRKAALETLKDACAPGNRYDGKRFRVFGLK